MTENNRSELPSAEKPGKEGNQEKISYERLYQLDGGRLSVAVSRNEDRYNIILTADVPGPLVLHWGLALRSRNEWVLPPSSLHPPGTTIFQNAAAQTLFVDSNGFRRLQMNISEQEAPLGILFALKQGDNGRWIKENGRNFFIPLSALFQQKAFSGSPEFVALADKIIENETGRNSWTLMHRFNLCHDLLDEIGGNNVDGLALIYVWLRFSYIRQLDWQRNYNTQPKELGHAMGRLTYKLAGRYIDEPGEREFIRLIMTTLGAGKDAQRVRDEILNIMHRHHIKELSGHFMEEWHQKLHNNATPDDIVICVAYLEFLMSNGNRDLFYKRLEEGGVTRERLENYERPIRSHPEFFPHIKEALIHDFQHFLGILKEVYAGADLGTAIHTSRYLFDAEMHGLMDYVWEHRNDHGKHVFILIEKISEARRRLSGRLGEHQSSVRDLLFLDLALEDFFRVIVERNLHADLSTDQLVELTIASLANLCFSNPDDEFVNCLLYWKRLSKKPRSGKMWSLQAKAVVDRLQRGLGNFIDRYCRILQPNADFLGKAFSAAPWAVNLFTEEVVRGRPAFVLSMLLRKLDPILRKSADLGDWQVISPGCGAGVVEAISDLKLIQGRRFGYPTVIVADNVEGNEEIPEGIIALITPGSIDVLSHLAVRARNARILFAVCYSPDLIAELKSRSGCRLELSVSATGDIVFKESPVRAGSEMEEASAPLPHILSAHAPVHAAMLRPVFSVYAIPMGDFKETNVGGKANNLKRMHGKLPDWIHLPASAALPFGVFEKVLAEPENKETAERYKELILRIDEKTEVPLLEEIKKTILALRAPDELISSLRSVMEHAGLGQPEILPEVWPEMWPKMWNDAWECIKRVWGSKWNERACLNRNAHGIPHEDLIMAVLIQRVVEADYSFVIHTNNPFTNNKNEIYAEVVLGLGEALVANYPGRALSFTCMKGGRDTHLLSFPSKSIGLFGSGLIFRSDSNGEDIAGYAGAGLYDSFMLQQPAKVALNYTEEALVWDEAFRREFLLKIADAGISAEDILGFPQDIEGAYSNGQYYIVQSRPQVGI